jgi:hypothetical protein
MEMYLWLARLVIVIHFFAVFVLLFGVATFMVGRFFRLSLVWRLISMTTSFGFVSSQLLLHDCVFTVMEKRLRSLGRTGSSYVGSFLGNYFPYLSTTMDRHGSQITAIGATLLTGMLLRVGYLWWKKANQRTAVRVLELSVRSSSTTPNQCVGQPAATRWLSRLYNWR